MTIPSQRVYVHYQAQLCATPSLAERVADRSLQYTLLRTRLVMLPKASNLPGTFHEAPLKLL